MNTRNISFSEKKVSKNAVITLVMGIIILIGFVINDSNKLDELGYDRSEIGRAHV